MVKRVVLQILNHKKKTIFGMWLFEECVTERKTFPTSDEWKRCPFCLG